MHADDELERWQREWRAQPAVPVDLRRLVERDIRGRRLNMLASIAVTVIMGGGTSLWAIRSGEQNLLVIAGAVWIFIAVAWVLRRQLERQRDPRPFSDTSAAFLDYAIRSRRAGLRAIAVSAVLYVAWFVILLALRYRISPGMPDFWTYLSSPRVLTLVAISGVLGVLAGVKRRRLTRELQNLEQLSQTVSSKRDE